ncbi:hypothetical protein FRB96_009008 [Tulasnella sp. 330]|nr:hypothetical protein FRB96_009008 [Tulasnella sp. 330]
MAALEVYSRFSMGEYQGNPSYLVQSAKGLLWLNLPDELNNLLHHLSSGDVLDFSLGPSGKFYIKWKVGGTVKQNRLSLGSGETHWGAAAESSKSFHQLEPSLRGQVVKAESKYHVQHFRFVSLGADDTFCFNLAGSISARVKDPRLKVKLQAARKSGRSILNIVLSPASTTSWLIMYTDGTQDGKLPEDWWKDIKPYFQPQYSLLRTHAQRLPASPVTPTAPIRMLNNSAEFRELHRLFMDGWKHPDKQLPSLVRIHAIDLPESVLRPYLTYRSRLKKDLGQDRFDERMTFHGTPRECCIGDPEQTLQLCSGARCNVDRAGTRPERNFMRFGRGLYTTSVSSKADDYNVTQTNSSYKAMLVAKVVLGRGYSLSKTNKQLSRPPRGYHSVLGTVGGDLRYDEQVVYRDDAIHPAYLLLYQP